MNNDNQRHLDSITENEYTSQSQGGIIKAGNAIGKGIYLGLMLVAEAIKELKK